MSSVLPEKKHIFIVGQQKDSLRAYIKACGIPDGLMVYTSIQQLQGLTEEANNGGGVQHAEYFSERYPNAILQVGLYLKGALDDVLSGVYDNNISKLARWIKRTKRPVLLRIGYEFDLPENGYDAKSYQRAFRYIVNHLREKRVRNAFFVWHSANRINGLDNVFEWYPGDEYVDLFAVSIFNDLQFGNSEFLIKLAVEHKKTFMIAEAAPAGLYTQKAKLDWLRHFFDFIKRHDVKIVSYISSDWDSYPLFKSLNWGDSRVHSDPVLKNYWMEKIHD